MGKRVSILALLFASACSRVTGVEQDAETPPGSADTCVVDEDCTWSEIDREILSAKDCICLYGCPYVPLNNVSAERRSAQYARLCDPKYSGDGTGCGIDDCAVPPRIACNDGVCGAAAADSP